MNKHLKKCLWVGFSLLLLTSLALPSHASYQCLRLDGNGYASIANADQAGLNMGLSDFMIEARIKADPTGSGIQRLIRKGSDIQPCWWVRLDDTGCFRGYIHDRVIGSRFAIGTVDLRDGKWHYVALAMDRSSDTGLRLYLDGSIEAITPHAIHIGTLDNTDKFQISGYSGTADFFKGLIDEVRIWNFGKDGLPDDYADYIAWRAQGRNVFKDISEYGIINSYIAKTNEYKGQLHTHTTNSDGADTPTALETAYRDAGYDFMAIADHDFLTPDPSVSGILHIDGVEESATGGHILSINPTSQKTQTAAQDIIDAIISDGAVPVMAHPNYPGINWTDAELEAIKDYSGIEVYNALVSPNSNAEDKWDTLLTKYIRSFGTAADDCHNIASGAFNKAWVKVFADSLTVSDIVDALKNGNFYASTGPTLSISVSEETVTVTTDSSSTITWIGSGGSTLRSTIDVTSDSYTVIGNEIYVRIKITRNSDDKNAWSNPIYIGNWNCYADADREERLTLGDLDDDNSDFEGAGPDGTDISTNTDWAKHNSSAEIDDEAGSGVNAYNGSNFCMKAHTATGGVTPGTSLSGATFRAAFSIGKWYEVSFDYKVQNCTAARVVVKNAAGTLCTVPLTSESWTTVRSLFQVLSVEELVLRLYSHGTDPTGDEVVWLDNVSIKEIGKVGHWKFEGDYSDETSNNNLLVEGGSNNAFPGYTLKKEKIISPYSVR